MKLKIAILALTLVAIFNAGRFMERSKAQPARVAAKPSLTAAEAYFKCGFQHGINFCLNHYISNHYTLGTLPIEGADQAAWTNLVNRLP